MSWAEVSSELLAVPDLQNLISYASGLVRVSPGKSPSRYPFLTDIKKELSREELARQRFRMHAHEYENVFNLGPRWGPSLMLYYRILPSGEVRRNFLSLMRLLSIHALKYDELIRDVLSQLTVIAKKTDGTIHGIESRFLQYLENLGGYAEVTNSDLDAAAIAWVADHSKNTEYMDLFKRAISKLESDIDCNYISEFPTIDQFISNRELWATQGGSSLSGRIEDSEGNKLTKTKASSALIYTDSEVKAEMLLKKKQHNKVAAKRELTKVRAVISGDFSTYMKMTYVSLYLDQIFKNNKLSILFMSKFDVFSKWQSLCASLTGSNFCFPFDQSAFDQHVSLEQVMLTLNMLKRILLRRFAPQAVISVMDLIIYALDGGQLELLDGRLVPIAGGICSGWRWTALLDTLINILQLYTFKEYCIKEGITCTISNESFFGDDITMRMLSKDDAINYTWYMMQNDYVANPKKIFVSSHRDEFLRKLITKDGARGYLARAINSLFWRNPVNPEPRKGFVRASEQLNSWTTLIGRGASRKQVEQYMTRDIANANGWTLTQVASLLSTPKSFNGLGYNIDFKQEWLGIEVLELEDLASRPIKHGYSIKNKYYGSGDQIINTTLSKLPGLATTSKYWGIDPVVRENDLGSWNKELDPIKTKLFEVGKAEKDHSVLLKIPDRQEQIIAVQQQDDTVPVWKEDVPMYMINGYIQSLLRMRKDKDRDKDGNDNMSHSKNIYNILSSKIENTVLSDRVYTNLGFRQWIKWLTGGLEIVSPELPGYDNGYVSMLLKPMKRLLFLSLTSRRCTIKKWNSKNAAFEVWCKNWFSINTQNYFPVMK